MAGAPCTQLPSGVTVPVRRLWWPLVRLQHRQREVGGSRLRKLPDSTCVHVMGKDAKCSLRWRQVGRKRSVARRSLLRRSRCISQSARRHQAQRTPSSLLTCSGQHHCLLAACTGSWWFSAWLATAALCPERCGTASQWALLSRSTSGHYCTWHAKLASRMSCGCFWRVKLTPLLSVMAK